MNPNDQELINNYKASNPSAFSPSPVSAESGWYSGVKTGAYRPTGTTNPTTPPANPSQIITPQGESGIVGGAVGNFATNINKDLTKRGQDLSSAITDTSERAQRIGYPAAFAETGLRGAGAAAGGIIDFANDAVKAIPGIGSWIDSISKNLAQQTQENPDSIGAKVISKLNEFSTKHPEAMKDLSFLVDIGGAVVGMKGAEELGANAPKLVQGTKDIASGAVDAVKGLGSKSSGALAPEGLTQKTIDAAVKDATPAYSKKLIGEPAVKTPDVTNPDGTITKGTTTPRVQEGGKINGRTVTPTTLEKDAGAALSKIEGYPAKGTNLEKYQSIQPEIAKQGQALRSSLANESLVRTHGEMMGIVESAVNKVPENSMVLSKADPVIENYLRVAKNAVDSTDRTLTGELEFSNKLDDAYENARGKLAFGSDKISALDEIHTAARNALKQDLINSAKSTDVKAALKSQWDLYRASDVLRAKAEAEVGTSLGRFGQNHPFISKGIKSASRAAGIGVGVHVIP